MKYKTQEEHAAQNIHLQFSMPDKQKKYSLCKPSRKSNGAGNFSAKGEITDEVQKNI